MRGLLIILGLGLAWHGLSADADPAYVYTNRNNLLVVANAAGELKPVQTAEDWQLRCSHILANMQRVMGPLPEQYRKLPLDLKILEETPLAHYFRQKITFRAEPDDCVSAYLLIPRYLTYQAPAMLCLHQTIDIGKEEPVGLGGDTNLHYAHELAERGYVTLAPDYWTFGDYRGKPYDPYRHGYLSGTMKGIWNHIRAIDLLASLPEVDPHRIGCIGHSLGGHNALWLAAFDSRIKVVVSSCGFSSMADYAISPYGGGNLHNYAQRRYMPRIASLYHNDPAQLPFDWPEILAVLAPRPVFINAPLWDENFRIGGVSVCVQAAQTVYKWMGKTNQIHLVYPDAQHSFPPAIREAAYRFIDKTLR